jgi:hypothetical protein
VVAPSALPAERQLEDGVEELVAVWAGQVCPVPFVDEPLPSFDAVAPELAAGVGLAAKTLATPQVLSAPAMTSATTLALTRDGLRVAAGTPLSGFSRVGSMRSPFM